MKLRLRLTVIVCAVSLPLVLGLFIADARSRHGTAARLLAHVARGHMMSPGERERCEGRPQMWGGQPLPPGEPNRHSGPGDGRPPGEPVQPDVRPHRRAGTPGEHHRRMNGPSTLGVGPDNEPHGAPPVLYAYNRELVAANPDAPPLGADWADSIAHTNVGYPQAWWPGEQVEVLVRTPWNEGPCALLLARGTTTAGWIGAILPATPIWLLPLAAVIIVLLLATGPLVRRIVRLAKLVRTSAESGFVAPVLLKGDDEVAELSRAFDSAARTVREQLAENRRREQALREFLANTTHDVMTPLTALADHLTSLDECAQRKEIADASILTAAITEVQYLASILDNLAIAAKLDAGEPELDRTEVNLNQLLERVVTRHRTIARRSRISLELGLPEETLWTYADLTLFEQAIGNLVDNAIRHNQAGGHAAVLLEQIDETRFCIRVRDDGPGIASDQIEDLLRRGARGARTREALAPADNRRPGQGLGLAIAFRVADRHGFSLEFDGAGGLRVDVCGDLWEG